MQEPHLSALLEHVDAVVDDTRQAVGQSGQLVVVGGEQRPAAGALVDVLDHGLGDGHAVIGRGPPPHLVEHHQ